MLLGHTFQVYEGIERIQNLSKHSFEGLARQNTIWSCWKLECHQAPNEFPPEARHGRLRQTSV